MTPLFRRKKNDATSKEVTTPAVKKPAAENAVKKATAALFRILEAPRITEKAVSPATQNQYVFAVQVDANKFMIKQAVHARYGILPVKVNIVNMLGKRTGRGSVNGKRKNWKKAYVTVPHGTRLPLEVEGFKVKE